MGAVFEKEAVEANRIERPANSRAAFEQRDFERNFARRRDFAQPERRGESRYSPADYRDAPHLSSLRPVVPGDARIPEPINAPVLLDLSIGKPIDADSGRGKAFPWYVARLGFAAIGAAKGPSDGNLVALRENVLDRRLQVGGRPPSD